jgi:prophage regulatory protein
MDVKLDSHRIVRMQEVTERVALKPSTIYGMVQVGKFPAPFKIIPGGRAAGWMLQDIEAWLRMRASEGVSHE